MGCVWCTQLVKRVTTGDVLLPVKAAAAQLLSSAGEPTSVLLNQKPSMDVSGDG